MSGAWLGLFVGLLWFIFFVGSNPLFILWAMLIGAGFGILFGIVTYAITRRYRDFSSTQQLVVTSYQVIIDPDWTAKAQAVLSQPEPEKD